MFPIMLLLVSVLVYVPQETSPEKYLCASVSDMERTGWTLCEPVGGAEVPAKVCLGVACVESRLDGEIFAFGPKARSVNLSRDFHAILFTAEQSISASANNYFVALVVQSNDGSLRNIAPKIKVPENAEFLLWSSRSVSAWKLYSIAFPVASKSQPLFGKHRYKIRTFAFDPDKAMYCQIGEIETKKRYPGLDYVQRIEVIEQEQIEIEKSILQHK